MNIINTMKICQFPFLPMQPNAWGEVVRGSGCLVSSELALFWIVIPNRGMQVGSEVSSVCLRILWVGIPCSPTQVNLYPSLNKCSQVERLDNLNDICGHTDCQYRQIACNTNHCLLSKRGLLGLVSIRGSNRGFPSGSQSQGKVFLVGPSVSCAPQVRTWGTPSKMLLHLQMLPFPPPQQPRIGIRQMAGTRARRAEFQMSSSHEHPPGLGQLSGCPFSGTFQDGIKDPELPRDTWLPLL